MPPFQGKRGRQNGGVPSLLSLWHPEHLCFDQFSMFEFYSLRLHFLKKGIRRDLRAIIWKQLVWAKLRSRCLSFAPLEFKNNIPGLYGLSQVTRTASLSATSSFWLLRWHTLLGRRDSHPPGMLGALDPWLPFVLTTPCSSPSRMKSFLSSWEAGSLPDPVALFSLSSVIITHLAPSKRTVSSLFFLL